jgi:hypothetical protein
MLLPLRENICTNDKRYQLGGNNASRDCEILSPNQKKFDERNLICEDMLHCGGTVRMPAKIRGL